MNALECIWIHPCSCIDDINPHSTSFNPLFTHHFFGDNESIDVTETIEIHIYHTLDTFHYYLTILTHGTVIDYNYIYNNNNSNNNNNNTSNNNIDSTTTTTTTNNNNNNNNTNNTNDNINNNATINNTTRINTNIDIYNRLVDRLTTIPLIGGFVSKEYFIKILSQSTPIDHVIFSKYSNYICKLPINLNNNNNLNIIENNIIINNTKLLDTTEVGVIIEQRKRLYANRRNRKNVTAGVACVRVYQQRQRHNKVKKIQYSKGINCSNDRYNNDFKDVSPRNINKRNINNNNNNNMDFIQQQLQQQQLLQLQQQQINSTIKGTTNNNNNNNNLLFDSLHESIIIREGILVLPPLSYETTPEEMDPLEIINNNNTHTHTHTHTQLKRASSLIPSVCMPASLLREGTYTHTHTHTHTHTKKEEDENQSNLQPLKKVKTGHTDTHTDTDTHTHTHTVLL
eukprot:GHVR01143360.1.p1 GENE.GHVR01143360.1~~GHVR01143360.1.p1  ORF type:complete len:455 (-),score=249.27 GHVR01143360.1:116-1480(-)